MLSRLYDAATWKVVGKRATAARIDFPVGVIFTARYDSHTKNARLKRRPKNRVGT